MDDGDSKIPIMSLENLMDEARKLDGRERRRLAAFLTTLRDESEPSFAEEMARVLDDNTPGHWFTLDDLKKRYANDDA